MCGNGGTAARDSALIAAPTASAFLRQKANSSLASRHDWPHLLVRALLAEQLYRRAVALTTSLSRA